MSLTKNLDEVRYSRAVIPAAAFRQHHFDVTPLLEQDLVLQPVGIIIECNFVGETEL